MRYGEFPGSPRQVSIVWRFDSSLPGYEHKRRTIMEKLNTTILWGDRFDGEASLGQLLEAELHNVPAGETVNAETVYPTDSGEVF